MKKEIFHITLRAIFGLLLFSCGKQESPVDFAETSVNFSYSVATSEDDDTIASVTVTINCLAESHPNYDGNIEDFNDESFWKIILLKESNNPDITGEDVTFDITVGTSAVYTHKFDIVIDDIVALEVKGKYEVQYAPNLKKVYKILATDDYNIPGVE
jgi:hypothetical protein